MSRRNPVLLRYRFANLNQLGRHLHPGEGHTLFFYRAPHPPLAFGDCVFMEVALEDSEQSVLMRGTVLGAVADPTPGVWLRFAETGLQESANGGKALMGRKQRRLACEAMVEVAQNDTRAIGRLVDVSLGGARILDALAKWSLDVAVQVRVLVPDTTWPAEIGLAQLVRVQEGQVAIRFVRSDSKTRVAAMRLFGAVQDQWARAGELSHPHICCVGGVHLDPVPPRVDVLQRRHAQS